MDEGTTQRGTDTLVHRWKSPQVPHTDRQVACHPVNNSYNEEQKQSFCHSGNNPFLLACVSHDGVWQKSLLSHCSISAKQSCSLGSPAGSASSLMLMDGLSLHTPLCKTQLSQLHHRGSGTAYKASVLRGWAFCCPYLLSLGDLYYFLA